MHTSDEPSYCSHRIGELSNPRSRSHHVRPCNEGIETSTARLTKARQPNLSLQPSTGLTAAWSPLSVSL